MKTTLLLSLFTFFCFGCAKRTESPPVVAPSPASTSSPASAAEVSPEGEKKPEARVDYDQCSDRKSYIQEKIRSSSSPADFLKTVVAQGAPRVLIVGDTHNVKDYAAWLEQMIPAYKKANPKFDCVFVELDRNKKQFAHGLYDRGIDLYKKHGDFLKTVEAYALEQGGSYQFEENGKYSQFTLISSDDYRMSLYVESAPMRWFYENGVRVVAIDDLSNFRQRDDKMAKKMIEYLQGGQCQDAIAFLGKAHLPGQKKRLQQESIEAMTIGFQTSDPYVSVNEMQSLWDLYDSDGVRRSDASSARTVQVTTTEPRGFYDVEDCVYGSAPFSAVAFFTRDESAPFVEGKEDIFAFRWNSFDAQIVGQLAQMRPYPEVNTPNSSTFVPAYPVFGSESVSLSGVISR